MADNGLTIDEELAYAANLSVGERFREDFLSSNDAKAYSAILLAIEKDIKSSLKDQNYLKVLDLEKVCQKHDAKFLKIEPEQAVKCMGNVASLRQAFVESNDPEKVRARFMPTVETLEAYGARVRDGQFEANIRSVSRIIGGCIGKRSNYAEKSIYETRQNALLEVKKAYQKNLDKAFGYEKKKEKTKEQDKDFSR